MRTTVTINVPHIFEFKHQLLAWSQEYQDVLWLDSNAYKDKFSTYDAVLAIGAHSSITCAQEQAFQELEQYIENINDWVFGFLTYDLKNSIEDLKSNNFDGLKFPDLYFFQPRKLFFITGDCVELCYLDPYAEAIEADLDAIHSTVVPQATKAEPLNIQSRITKATYLNKVEQMLDYIHRGDIYEANFCQEFYAEGTNIDVLQTYLKLNQISQPPFSTFLKRDDKYLLSASPERFLKKEGTRLLSQPIKGTAKRSEDPREDELLKQELARDEKERSENIMIVDLVRNDLSHTAVAGSVKVTELCEVYSFLQVHQMISTVEAKLRSGVSGIEALKHAFPMGSMTGAPKISAMKIIEELESTKRGLYSGCVGYITPDGDFDFNVVIRSILYNASAQYTSFSVGSAITAKSSAIKEYEECLLKAKAMRQVLEN